MLIPEPAIRFRPFSHLPGIHCLLPGSLLTCQVYPVKVVVFHKDMPISEINIEGTGPIEQFTVVQDLEKGHIQVGGFCEGGYLRYQIYPVASRRDFGLRILKKPEKVQLLTDKMLLAEERVQFGHRERLFLGCTKAQDWQQLLRRQDIREILPFWYWLAQSVPYGEKKTSTFFKPLEEAVLQQKRDMLNHLLLSNFLVSFKGMGVPRLHDDAYLGIEAKNLAEEPLQESFPLLRKIFFLELPNHLYILPALPPTFHCGMLYGCLTANGHRVHIEWTKQLARRVWIESGCDEVITIAMQKPIKSFRMRGDVTSQVNNFSQVQLKKGMVYLLDNIQK